MGRCGSGMGGHGKGEAVSRVGYWGLRGGNGAGAGLG